MKQRYRILSVLLFFVVASITALAQQRTISGTILDSNGTGMPGVNVIVKGTSSGTTSDSDGKYSLSAGAEATTLVFSFIGYATQEVEIGNRTTVDVTMAEDINELNEVVVTALGIERDKKALQYSVTEVGGENFTQARENNIGNALSGRVAGVNVTKISSGPAGSSRILIRGNKTLGGQNQPLYVVDGIPIDRGGYNNSSNNYGQAGLWGGRDEGDALSSINPDDIESITVLKGANASALYGSRGGNGVINIVTKKGSAKKGIGVDFNTNYVFETVNNLSDLQTEYGAGNYVGGVAKAPSTVQEAFNWGNVSWGERLDPNRDVIQFDGIVRPYGHAGDNWKRFYETGSSWTNSISLSGGNQDQNFRFSVADLRSDGILPNSGYDRTNLTFSANSKFGKSLTFNGKVMYSHENAHNRPVLSDSPGNAVQSVWRTPTSIDITTYRGDPNKLGAIAPGTSDPLLLIYGQGGDPRFAGQELLPAANNWGQNPYWAQHQFINDDITDRIITSGQLRYDITSWLYASGRIGMDYYTRRDKSLTPEGTGYQLGGALTEGEDRVREINMEWILGGNKTFGKYNVNAFVGGNRMRRDWERISADGNGFNVPFFPAISNAKTRNYNYGFAEQGINSVFASAEVSYNSILYLTATAREDWWSILNPPKNHLLYPSVGASFVFSDAFAGLPNWLSFGKVRASWAQTGFIGDLNPYDANLTYSLNANSHLGRTMATFSSAGNNNGVIPNPSLVPAKSTEVEFGFDVRLFENRLGIDVTYYDQKTVDDILRATVSRASGFGFTYINVGELQNRGIEILITGSPLKGGPLEWEASFNIAKNNNKVLRLIEGNDELTFEESRTRTTAVKHILGHPFGMITGIVQERDPQGRLVFNDDGTPARSAGYEILGNGVADWSGGFNNSFTYKGINLTFLIDIRVGGDIHSGTNIRLTQWGVSKESLIGREGGMTISGVVRDGDDFVPVERELTPDEARNYWNQLGERASENYIFDGGYGKLRQVTLGYSLPRTLLSKTPFQNVTLSFVARNLAILWKNVPNIDPESAYSANSGAQGLEYFAMPTTRSYGFNLRVGF